MRQIGLWTLIAGAIVVGGWLAFRPRPVPCDIVAIERGALSVRVEEDGRTRLTDRYIVSAPIAGRLDRIALRPGDDVLAGETVLARIAPSDPDLLDERARAEAEARVRATTAALDRANAELRRAEAQLEYARTQYGRVLDAAGSGAGTTKEVDDALLEVRTSEQSQAAARFSLEIARFELEQAQAALLQTTGDDLPDANQRAIFEVQSPITGKTLRVMRESAGVVSPGDELVELGSLDALEIEVDVLSDHAVRVLPGAPVTLTGWGGESTLSGVVRLVEPSGFTKVSALGVEEQRVNIIIDFVDPVSARSTLGDNFRVEVSIVVWESPEEIVAPLGALFRDGEGWATFVVESGRARLRHVTIGERSSSHAQITGGLAEREQVIVFPSDRISEGVRVRAR